MSLRISRQWLYGTAFPIALVVMPVFVDISYGMLGTAGRAGFLSVGVIVRGTIALLAILLLLRMRATPLKPFLFVLLSVFLVSNVIWALNSEVYSLGHELNQGFKLAFPWLLAGTLLYLDRRQKIDPTFLLTLIAWVGFISAIAMFAAAGFGFDRTTYGDWSYGSKGMFNAQNDIGLSLLLALVASMVILIRTRRMLHLVMTASIASAGMLLGTRTGVLGPPLVVVALILAAFLNRNLFRPADGRRNLRRTAVLVVPVAIAALVAGAIFSQSEKTNYLLQRIESLSEGTPRAHLEAAGIERLRDREAVFTLFGDGGLAFKKYVSENVGKGRDRLNIGTLTGFGENARLGFPVHRVENDVIDVLGFYGVLQFAVIYGALALFYGLTVRRAIRAWNLENVAWLVMFTLFLGHSTFAGHGLFSAQVATLFAPVLFIQLRELSWRWKGQPERPTDGVSGTMEVEA